MSALISPSTFDTVNWGDRVSLSPRVGTNATTVAPAVDRWPIALSDVRSIPPKSPARTGMRVGNVEIVGGWPTFEGGVLGVTVALRPTPVNEPLPALRTAR